MTTSDWGNFFTELKPDPDYLDGDRGQNFG